EALRSAPEDPELLTNRGGVRRTLGDLAGAAEDHRAAIRSSPGFAAARANLAICLFAARDFRGAREMALEFVRLAPDHARAPDLRGLAEECDEALRAGGK
ncbi:MAG: tetratricopeptide repeat protein, partial [Planctomycetales bacterium]|nr:tetratricopeptide repeat protein [Planctomycetales bacterium]